MGINKNYYKIILVFLLLLVIFWCICDEMKNINITENFTENRIVKHKYDDYEILEIYDILTPAECKELIRLANKKGLHQSEILNNTDGKDTEVRTEFRKSKQAWLPNSYDKIVMKIAKFSEKITGIPKENQEELQVAKYEENGKFIEHYDSCIYEDKAYCDKVNHYSGERRTTLLIYLNDDFKEGQTEFVEVGLKIKPEVGKGILFWSTDHNDNLFVKSKHKGNSVIGGEKWIATKWSHPKKFN